MGCSEPTPEPEIASAAPLAGYARRYPDEVDATLHAFGEGEVEAKELYGRFRSYPTEYDDEKMDFAVAAELLQHAGEVGRARAYYERLDEVHGVRTFYDEEKEEIRRKVAGAAQHTAQQAGCSAEVGGAAAVTLDKMIDEKLDERLQEANDARRLLERHETTLGDENVAALGKQIDEVARASYLVHIGIVERKVRLRRLVEEAPRVQQTADELIEQEHRFQSQPGRSDADKQAAGERIEAMKTAKARMQQAVRGAERSLEKLDQRIEQAQQGYREALDALLRDLRSRAGAG